MSVRARFNAYQDARRAYCAGEASFPTRELREYEAAYAALDDAGREAWDRAVRPPSRAKPRKPLPAKGRGARIGAAVRAFHAKRRARGGPTS